MAEIDDSLVKRGYWTNIGNGAILGQTITMESQAGTICVAVLAVMSTVGTSHLWSLLIFAYHQWRARGGLADGLSRQQQAILRTQPTPSSLMADSIKMWWLWRKHNEKVLLRSITQFLLAAVCAAAFVAASISSSFVVDSSDLQVLVESFSCGFVNRTAIPADDSRAYSTAVRGMSEPYAQECYGVYNSSARCKTFIKPRIDFQTKRAPCPFKAEFCVDPGDDMLPAFSVGTGLVDVNDGLGLNLPKHERVYYSKSTTCAVLPIEGYISYMDTKDFPPEYMPNPPKDRDKLMLFHYGDRPKFNEWRNTSALLVLWGLDDSLTYSIRFDMYYKDEELKTSWNNITPIGGLRQESADVGIAYLGNGMRFSKPVDDPWFRAHNAITQRIFPAGIEMTYNHADSQGRAMGCTFQHQFCIAAKFGQKCSSKMGLASEVDALGLGEATSLQNATLKLLLKSVGTVDTVSYRAVQLENVQSSGITTLQVPKDQWTIEVRAAEAFVWSTLQVLVADYAMGPSVRTPAISSYIAAPETVGEKQLCNSQRMRKTGRIVNVNVFGLVFVLASAVILAVMNLVLLKFLIFLGSFRKALSPRIDRWIQDGVLQLQRRAYEAQGQGTWSNLDRDVPLTRGQDRLPDLPIESVAKDEEEMSRDAKMDGVIRRTRSDSPPPAWSPRSSYQPELR